MVKRQLLYLLFFLKFCMKKCNAQDINMLITFITSKCTVMCQLQFMSIMHFFFFAFLFYTHGTSVEKERTQSYDIQYIMLIHVKGIQVILFSYLNSK